MPSPPAATAESATLCRENLRPFVDAGLISERQHPSAPLWIYNYTARTTYERQWTPETLACRGLILDGDSQIVARPFRKFFNLGEPGTDEAVFASEFTVTEKMDGSLGVYYEVGGAPAIATRGSFESDQAKWATRHLAAAYPGWRAPSGMTPLFEIIYPENRIVVDYGKWEGLVLLTVIDNVTGRDLPLDAVEFPGIKVRHYDSAHYHPREIAAALAVDDGNSEGFVLRFDHDGRHERVKVKLSEYIRLHRLVTGVSNKSIWEALRVGASLNDLLERVPDEFYDWVRQEEQHLKREHSRISLGAKAAHESILAALPDGWTRRDYAEIAKAQQCRALLFLLLDGRDISDAVWKLCEPEFSRPFKRDIDA